MRNDSSKNIVIRKSEMKRGDGIIDKIIDKVPFEMHVPGYQYCGPGIYLMMSLQSKQFYYYGGSYNC